MKLSNLLALAALSVAFVGCAVAPQRSIELDPAKLSAGNGKIGVAMPALPKVDTSFPGAGCLLCLAAAAGANSDLTKHANTLPYEGLDTLKQAAADALRKKGADVVVIDEPLDVRKLPAAKQKSVEGPKKNFTALKAKYQVDRLVVLDVQSIGFVRTYSSYFPTSDPKATIQGAGYMVDLNTNAYEWYLPVQFLESAEGAWDEAPKFPGLTNAYFQTVEKAKDAFLAPLTK
jgi:hypothetical protein